MEPKIFLTIEGIDKQFEPIEISKEISFGEPPSGGIVVHIKSWWPCWMVKMKLKYVLWKTKK
jgi:hypothetical protein